MTTSSIRNALTTGLGLLLGLAVAPGAVSQTIPSPYRFIEGTHSSGLVVGFVNDNRGELGLGPGGGTLFGGRYAIELRGPLALELTGYLLPTDRVVYQAVSGVGLVPLGPVDMTLAALDARLRFTLTGARTWRGLAPFVSLGGGLVGNFAAQSEVEAPLTQPERFAFGPSFLGTMGGGLRFIPGDRIEFRADASLSIWKLGTPVGFNTVEQEFGPLPDQEWIGVTSVIFGVIYRF